MTTTYRYLFADLLTNTIIAELPLTGVAFNSQLNQAGTFQGHILLSGIDTVGFNIAEATIPAKCAVYVDRDGVLVWGGGWGGRSSNTGGWAISYHGGAVSNGADAAGLNATANKGGGGGGASGGVGATRNGGNGSTGYALVTYWS